jgi:asparagine synthase (glutamine-hydrolysing)
MCGISASIANTARLYASDAWGMVKLGDHRGPDGSAIACIVEDQFAIADSQLVDQVGGNWCTLGHSRLTIVDLSNQSSQPYVSVCKKYAMVYNGEIYNYIELRSELESLGVKFYTTGDTEVLFEALIMWGKDALPKLNGMFAFVFVDGDNKKSLIARDRYGIKPLHVLYLDDEVHFASEIKQFTKLAEWKAVVNEEVAREFLLYGITDHRKETMFAGVERLQPGHYIEVLVNETTPPRQECWFTLENQKSSLTYDQAVSEYREKFISSIRMHLRSDVEIGSCLSGGLDSSAIVGVASLDGAQQRIHTFTASSELSTIDETRFADAVNNFCDTIPHVIQPSFEVLLSELENLVWHQDEPFGGTSVFAQWTVFKLVKSQNIKVVLDGQGADEQLGGYNSFINTYLASLLRRGRILHFVRVYSSFRRNRRVSTRDFLKFVAYQNLPSSVVFMAGRALRIPSQNGGNWLRSSDAGTSDPFKVGESVPRSVRELSRQMITVSNLPMLLRFEDRNSMAHGVEARVPFVDNELMDLAGSLDDAYLMVGSTTKKLLRDSLGSFLPPLVRDRTDKIGFQTAEQVWMGNNKIKFKQLVRDSVESCPRFFNEQTVRICDGVIDGTTVFTQVPWRVISFGLWKRIFDVDSCE